MKNKKNIMMKVVRNSITKIAEKKHMQIVLDLCMSLKNPKNILNHIKKEFSSYMQINIKKNEN